MTRKIYVYPGELIEVRIVPDGVEKNATEWNWSSQNKLLLGFHPGSIGAVDPRVELRSIDPTGKTLRTTRPTDDQ